MRQQTLKTLARFSRSLLPLLTVSILALGCNQAAEEPDQTVQMPVGQTEAGPAGGAATTQPGAGGATTQPGAAARNAQQPTGGHEDGVIVASVAFAVPDDWVAQRAEGLGRVAQYQITADGGEGEVVLYYFGPQQGGGAMGNVQRWIGQFSNNEGIEPAVDQRQQGGLNVTTVRTQGTYNPGMAMPGMGPQEDFALYGAIIEGGPEGSVFVKATGPIAVIEAHEDALAQFIQSAHAH